MLYWKRFTQSLCVFLGVALVILQGGGAVYAVPSLSPEDAISIDYGIDLIGAISWSGEEDIYYFYANLGDQVKISMEGRDDLDSYIELKDASGNQVAYDDDNGYGVNALLLTTYLPATGIYYIHAHSWGYNSIGDYTINLSKAISVGWIVLDEGRSDSIPQAHVNNLHSFHLDYDTPVDIRLSMICVPTDYPNALCQHNLDPYLELYKDGIRIDYNDDGLQLNHRNSVLRKRLSAGTYTIVVSSWEFASFGPYRLSVQRQTNTNLAFRKPAYSSSVEASGYYDAYRAVDSDPATRWSSSFDDNNWLSIDLGSDQMFNQITLHWETAYAQVYQICYLNVLQWASACSTRNGSGGTETITFDPVVARYVWLQGVTRATQWGYSLWEFEVYNTYDEIVTSAQLTTVDKALTIVAPLTSTDLNDQDKEPVNVDEYLGVQESVQLSATTFSTITFDTPTDATLSSVAILAPIQPNNSPNKAYLPVVAR